VRYFRPRKHRVGLAVIACALLGRVSMREDQNDPGRFLRRARIDRFDLSFSDRRFDRKAIQRFILLHLIRVARSAGNFQSPVHAIERFADNALCVKCIRADG
jgi:hypothetical protein